MNTIERQILKKVRENTPETELTAAEADLIEFLSDRDPAYRLDSKKRNRLYKIGKKFGIDGKKEFASQAISRRRGSANE